MAAILAARPLLVMANGSFNHLHFTADPSTGARSLPINSAHLLDDGADQPMTGRNWPSTLDAMRDTWQLLQRAQSLPHIVYQAAPTARRSRPLTFAACCKEQLRESPFVGAAHFPRLTSLIPREPRCRLVATQPQPRVTMPPTIQRGAREMTSAISSDEPSARLATPSCWPEALDDML